MLLGAFDLSTGQRQLEWQAERQVEGQLEWQAESIVSTQHANSFTRYSTSAQVYL